MEILKTHQHRLIFRIDKFAPKEYMKKWNELKVQIESNENNKNIVDQIKNYCKLEKNKELPYLNRCEGGMGGDNNTINKQIRFRHLYGCINPNDIDNYIILKEITSTDVEKWTYSELDDLIYAIIEVFNNYIEAEAVNGCIELVNHDISPLSR